MISQRADTRKQAVLLLLVLGLLGIAGLLAVSSTSAAEPRSGVGDVATYEAMIARLRDGVPYYRVVGEELRRGHYATQEVFNWRTPLLMTSLAAVPAEISQALLLALAALVVVTTAAGAENRKAGGASALMQLGTFALLAGSDLRVMGEPWAGALIALSISAFHFNRRPTGVALGILALFVRELAAPYCVVCAAMALDERRWREVCAWIAGAGLYGIYFGWHVSQVSAHRLQSDLSHATSWVEFGGLSSVLSKLHWHGWLVLAPMPLTILALLIVVAGLLAPGTATSRARLTSAAYLCFFFVAGKQFDEYWGLIAWPILALAFGPGVQMIARALIAVRRADDAEAVVGHAPPG